MTMCHLLGAKARLRGEGCRADGLTEEPRECVQGQQSEGLWTYLNVVDTVEVELGVHVGEQGQARPRVALLQHPRVLGVQRRELEAPAAQDGS